MSAVKNFPFPPPSLYFLSDLPGGRWAFLRYPFLPVAIYAPWEVELFPVDATLRVLSLTWCLHKTLACEFILLQLLIPHPPCRYKPPRHLYWNLSMGVMCSSLISQGDFGINKPTKPKSKQNIKPLKQTARSPGLQQAFYFLPLP